MKILVTGGLGFIGHHVVSKLEDMDHDVTILDCFHTYGIIPHDELSALIDERSSQISSVNYISKIEWEAAENAFRAAEPDIVIHLASFPRQKVVNSDPTEAADSMIKGLLNICELSAKYKVKKLVYVSSSMVYGDFNGLTSESACCTPQGQYGIMKLAGEWLVKDYAQRGCFEYAVVRPSAVYGPRDVEDRVVSKFFMSAIRGETLNVNGEYEMLDFTYVDDTVDGIIGAALSKKASYGTFNISRGNARFILDAANIIVDIVGSGTVKVGHKHIDYPSRGTLNCSAAQRAFDFNPTIDIEEGFRRYYEYLCNSPFWTGKTVR